MLVCEYCGNGEFTSDHSAVIRITQTFRSEYDSMEIERETIDHDRDMGEVTCTDCGSELPINELTTKERYDNAE